MVALDRIPFAQRWAEARKILHEQREPMPPRIDRISYQRKRKETE